MAIGEVTEHDRTDRAHDERDPKGRERQQKRRLFVSSREEQPCNHYGEKAVDDKIEPLERISDRCGGNRTPAAATVRQLCRCHPEALIQSERGRPQWSPTPRPSVVAC